LKQIEDFEDQLHDMLSYPVNFNFVNPYLNCKCKLQIW
jgi:hypothetical protein